MADPILAADENFDFNFASAVSILNYFPSKERKVIQQWLERLQGMHSGTSEVLASRNDYMWTLLLCMQSNNLVPPFNRPPALGELPFSKQAVPQQMYGEVLRRTHAMTGGTAAAPAGHKPVPHRLPVTGKSVTPEDFLRSQPVPRDGAFCYMAAFSDWR